MNFFFLKTKVFNDASSNQFFVYHFFFYNFFFTLFVVPSSFLLVPLSSSTSFVLIITNRRNNRSNRLTNDHFSYITFYSDAKVIVRNSRFSGHWGTEERHGGMGGLMKNRRFVMQILVEPQQYTVRKWLEIIIITTSSNCGTMHSECHAIIKLFLQHTLYFHFGQRPHKGR